MGQLLSLRATPLRVAERSFHRLQPYRFLHRPRVPRLFVPVVNPNSNAIKPSAIGTAECVRTIQ